MAAFAALAGSPATAADLARCRAVADSQARLACYDALADGAAAAPSAGTGPTGNPRQATVAAPSGSSDNANFGFERVNRDQADELRSSIPGPFNGWDAKTQFKLANGQIWQVSDGSRAFYQLNNPTVLITRGALGNFFMQFDGRSHAVSVRRIK